MRSRARRDLSSFCKEAKSVPTWQGMELVARALFARLACMGGYRDLKGANTFLISPHADRCGSSTTCAQKWGVKAGGPLNLKAYSQVPGPGSSNCAGLAFSFSFLFHSLT